MAKPAFSAENMTRSKQVSGAFLVGLMLVGLGFTIVTGGANDLLSSQILSATLLFCTLIFFSKASNRQIFASCEADSGFIIGSLAVFAMMTMQLLSTQPCDVTEVTWARTASVTIDPDWTMRGIVSFAAAVAMICVGIVLGQSRQKSRWVLLGFQLMIVSVIAHAIFDWLSDLRAPIDSAAPDVPRLNGNFVSANTFASLMILSSCVSLGLWLDGWSKRFHPVARYEVGLSVFVTLTSLLALVATFSRAGVGLGILAIFSVFAVHKRIKRTTFLVWLLSSLCVGAIAIVGAHSLDLQFRRVDYSASFLNRVPEWASALALLEMRPCYGWGVGTFSLATQPIQLPPTSNMTMISSTPHNAFLLVLSDTGFVGLAAWSFLSFNCWKLCHIKRAPTSTQNITCFAIYAALGGVVLQNLVDYSLAVPAFCAISCLLFGLAVGMNKFRSNVDALI